MSETSRFAARMLTCLLLNACAPDDSAGTSSVPPPLDEAKESLTRRPAWEPVNRGVAQSGSTELASSHSVSIDATIPTLMYGLLNRGLYVSWSLGNRWSHATGVSVEAPYTWMPSLTAVDPNRPGRAYAALLFGYGLPESTALFRTDNGGLSWTRLPDPDTVGEAAAFAVAPGNSDVIYFSPFQHNAGPHLYKSTDSGATFQSVGEPDFLCCAPLVALSAEHVYGVVWGRIGLDRGFKHSTDGGKTWRPLREDVVRFAIARRHPTVIYATTAPGLIKSTDGGHTWSVPSAQFGDAFVDFVAVSPADSHVYIVVGGSVYVSSDGGTHFSEAQDGLTGQSVTEITPHPTLPCVAFAATEHGGVFRTTRAGGHCF